MQTINNYINERLNPKHLGSTKFPISGTLDNIKDFLEHNDFEEIRKSPFPTKYFNKMKIKGFMYNSTYLWFADTSKDLISDDNPVFCVDFSNGTLSSFNDNKYITRDTYDTLKLLNEIVGF
jgi:hypothetical protein